MSEKIYIQINDKRVEAKGKDLEQIKQDESNFLELKSKLEAEQKAKEEARKSAMAKLKALGLTDDEIAALVP